MGLSPGIKIIKSAKLLLLAAIWASVWYLLHGELYQSRLNQQFSAGSAFVLGITISFLAISIFSIVFILLLVKTEKIKDFRQFLNIERLDVRGIWICVGLGLLLQILNGVFLYNYILKPVQDFLSTHGLGGGVIGLGTGNIVPALSSGQAIFLTAFLLLFWWLEVPEELFFRGYIQNQFQPVTGKNGAMIISATIWDLAHVFGLAPMLERFFYGLLYGFVFRLRQNATPTMVVHPLGNRSLLLALIIPQIWGVTIAPSSSTGMLILVGIYAALLFGVILLWRVLKLDR